MTGKVGRYALGALLIDDRSPGQILAINPKFADRHALFTVSRLNRYFGQNSTAGVIYARRQFAGSYNHAGGVDVRFRMGKHWTTTGQALASSTRTLNGGLFRGPAYIAKVEGSGESWNYKLQYDDRAPGFHTETGFVQRNDVRSVSNNLNWRVRPRNSRLLSFGPDLQNHRIWDHQSVCLEASSAAQLNLEFVGQSSLAAYYSNKREPLRTSDFPTLLQNTVLSQHATGISLATALIPRISLAAKYSSGAEINFVPPAGSAPALASHTSTSLALAVRLTSSLTVDNTYLLTRLRKRSTGEAIFNNHIIRSKWNYQFSRKLSARAILQYSAVLASPQQTSLHTTKKLITDLLFTWQLHPGTALFVGYSNSLINPNPLASGPRVDSRFVNEGRQLFIKFSYLLRS